MMYLFKITVYCTMALLWGCMVWPSALAESETTVKDALYAAIVEKGPFYQWTLAEKAAFYNQYVYHGEGTRRGVPDERHIPPEIIKGHAPALLADCLGCEPEELSSYTVDVDFWIEAYMDDSDREHEFYTVCFLRVGEADEAPHNVYQVQFSAYSGELLEAMNLETGWTWSCDVENPVIEDQ